MFKMAVLSKHNGNFQTSPNRAKDAKKRKAKNAKNLSLMPFMFDSDMQGNMMI